MQIIFPFAIKFQFSFGFSVFNLHRTDQTHYLIYVEYPKSHTPSFCAFISTLSMVCISYHYCNTVQMLFSVMYSKKNYMKTN